MKGSSLQKEGVNLHQKCFMRSTPELAHFKLHQLGQNLTVDGLYVVWAEFSTLS